MYRKLTIVCLALLPLVGCKKQAAADAAAGDTMGAPQVKGEIEPGSAATHEDPTKD